MKWFGKPWPSVAYRAPICENDDDWIATPIGEACTFCPLVIERDSRGVMIPDLLTGEVGAVHIDCLLRNTIGAEMTNEILRTFT